MIFRVKKHERFTVISNEILEDSCLSWKSKGLLCYLLSKPDNFVLSVSYLEKKAKDGRDSVRSAILELIDAKYCRRVRLRDEKGKLKGFEYQVFDSKCNDNGCMDEEVVGDEASINGKSNVGFPNVGKTNVGKSPTNKYYIENTNTDINKKRDTGLENFFQENSNVGAVADKTLKLESPKKLPPSCAAPPSLKDVEGYLGKMYAMKEVDSTRLAVEFVNYYESVGWVTSNGERVRSWRGLLKVWYMNYQKSSKDGQFSKQVYAPRRGKRSEPIEVGAFTSDEFEGVKGW
jgi:hypothetical protein